MNNSRARLVKLLDSKLKLFEKMEILLTEQKRLFEEKDFEAYREKGDSVNVIIGKIKDIDYDLARCETNDDEIAELINSGEDREIGSKLREAMSIAERNNDLMDELALKLKSVKEKPKKKSSANMEMSKT